MNQHPRPTPALIWAVETSSADPSAFSNRPPGHSSLRPIVAKARETSPVDLKESESCTKVRPAPSSYCTVRPRKTEPPTSAVLKSSAAEPGEWKKLPEQSRFPPIVDA